ncbi:MAG: hypothetical protein ACLUTA_02960 [Blautia wexlerae]
MAMEFPDFIDYVEAYAMNSAPCMTTSRERRLIV